MSKKNKLVRDKIPEIIKNQNYEVKYHILDDDTYIEELYKKLREETEELISDRNIEELADVYEVMRAIADTMDISWEDIIEVARNKRERKGGFKDKIYLDDYFKKGE